MRRLLLVVCCCGGAVLASGMTNDVLHVPSDVLTRIEDAMWTEMLMEGLVTARVVDICVVGSYAQGCARVGSGQDSDMDIVVFVPSYRVVKASFGRRVAQRARVDMTLDVSVQLTNRMQKSNPDWIAYSLLERRLYGRPNGVPRDVKLLRSKEQWVALSRDVYAPAEAHGQQHGSVIFMSDGLLKCVHPGTGKVLTAFPARVEGTTDVEARQP